MLVAVYIFKIYLQIMYCCLEKLKMNEHFSKTHLYFCIYYLREDAGYFNFFY